MSVNTKKIEDNILELWDGPRLQEAQLDPCTMFLTLVDRKVHTMDHR